MHLMTPVSTPYGKANSSLRPDSFLKSLVILKIFALAALVQKFVRMTLDFKKLFTGPGEELYNIADRTVTHISTLTPAKTVVVVFDYNYIGM